MFGVMSKVPVAVVSVVVALFRRGVLGQMEAAQEFCLELLACELVRRRLSELDDGH